MAKSETLWRSVLQERWIVWGVLAAAHLLSAFHRVAPAVVADHLMAEFAIGAATVGALASMYFYVYVIMQVPTGMLVDSLGLRFTATAGSILAALGACLFAFAPSLFTAFVGRLTVGLGVSVAFVCVLKSQALWFRPTDFATLSSLLVVVNTVGTLAAATPLAALANGVGWRPAFMVSGIVSAVVAGLTWWLVRHPPAKTAVTSSGQSSQLTFRQTAAIVWRNRQTWMSFAAHFGWFGTYLTFTGLWGVPFFMQVYAFNRVTAANLMVAISIAFTAGSFLSGIVSDRWLKRRKPPLIAAGIINLGMWILIVFWPGAPPPITITIAALIVAHMVGAASILCFAVSKESNPPAASGLAIATANGGAFCAALLQPLIGYFLDLTWEGQMTGGARVYSAASYQAAFTVFVITGGVALVAALLIRETYGRDISENLRDKRHA